MSVGIYLHVSSMVLNSVGVKYANSPEIVHEIV